MIQKRNYAIILCNYSLGIQGDRNMEKEQSNYKILADRYKADVMKLAAYIPWLEQNTGKRVSSVYESNGELHGSITFPVYEGTLLQIIKTARNTQFMNRNYVYVYSRNHIKTVADELKMINKSSAKEFDILIGILSKYVLLGMTKSTLWSTGVTEGVFLNLFTKMKEIIDFWCQKQ